MIATQAVQPAVPEPTQPGLAAPTMPAGDPTPAPATTTAPAAGSPAAEQPATLPADLNQITWHGLRFRYDPQQYVFAQDRLHELPPDQLQPHESARLMQIPNQCRHDFPGSDCFPSEVRLALYPGAGLEPRAWVAATFTTPYRWPTAELIVDTVVAGRAALAWAGDGIRASETTYVVPLGNDMLVVDGDLQAIHDLGFEVPGSTGITTGSFAMTTPQRTWELWTAAEAGNGLPSVQVYTKAHS